jgi:hypothetical protein
MSRNVELDTLLAAAGAEVQPETVMLFAMLSDQIQSLGMMHARGMWAFDPAELGDWLRAEAEKGRSNSRSAWLMEAAMMEWQLWGRGTDVLIEVMERETLVRIDRARIKKLALECSSGVWSRGTARSHLGHAKGRRKEVAA